jgi:hypothetical protein
VKRSVPFVRSIAACALKVKASLPDRPDIPDVVGRYVRLRWAWWLLAMAVVFALSREWGPEPGPVDMGLPEKFVEEPMELEPTEWPE